MGPASTRYKPHHTIIAKGAPTVPGATVRIVAHVTCRSPTIALKLSFGGVVAVDGLWVEMALGMNLAELLPCIRTK